MTDNNDALRDFTRRLFADPDNMPAPTGANALADSLSAPVIPTQEKAADMKQRRTPEQIWVNKILNAGTIRENY